MSDLIITSPSNQRLKSLVALRRRRSREETGLTLIEGYEGSRWPSRPVVPRTLYYCPELMLDARQQLAVVTDVAARGADTVQLGRGRSRRWPTARPRRLPGGRRDRHRTCADLTVGPEALTLLCQGVEKPGNLGAMLRTADAAGVEAVIAADPVTDWGNPNRCGPARGRCSVPVASDDTAATVAWLRAQGVASSRRRRTPTSTTPTWTTRGGSRSRWAPRSTG